MSRSYKTVSEALPELERLIDGLKLSGTLALPPERQLMERLGISRMTLRKALSALEERGLFVKGQRVRLIDADGGKPASKVSVAFVTAGWEYPDNPVWFRLGMSLEKRLRAIGADYRTVYFNWGDPALTWPGGLVELPRVIVFAAAPNETIRMNVLALRDKALIVAVDEDYIGKCECVVALNNYAAGRRAAQMLLESGARRPAVIYCDRCYGPFSRRHDGFEDALREAGLPVDDCAYTVPEANSLRGSQALPKVVETLCQAGHDGLFLYSDEHVQMVSDVVRAFHKVPEEFKLVTLDASGRCRNQGSPMAAVGHGTEAVATRIAEIVAAVAKGLPFDKITLVEPEVYYGETLKSGRNHEERILENV